MRLAYLVQSHPSRAALLPRLLEVLPPSVTVVVSDPEPEAALRSSWRTYRACLERALTLELTHACIVQEDAVLCRDFEAVLARAVAAQPERLLVLCVCGNGTYAVQQMRRALLAGDPWVTLHRNQFTPTVGLVWPLPLIGRVLVHVDAQGWPEGFCADDGVVGRCMLDLGEVPLATVPSLVDHPDDAGSLMGKHAHVGLDPGRRTVCFGDGAEVDWTLPPGVY